VADALDVASWQGEIDGAAIRDAETGRVGLVVVKVSEGLWASNPYRSQQVGSTLEAGMRVGAYHFARPDVSDASGVVEADVFVRNLGRVADAPRPVLALDLEPFPGIAWPLDAGRTVRYAVAWLDRVRELVPHADVWWYSYPAFISSFLPREENLDRYGCWIADPSAWERQFTPRTGGREWVLHQIGVGPHAGVNGNVDLNVFGPAYVAGPREEPEMKSLLVHYPNDHRIFVYDPANHTKTLVPSLEVLDGLKHLAPRTGLIVDGPDNGAYEANAAFLDSAMTLEPADVVPGVLTPEQRAAVAQVQMDAEQLAESAARLAEALG
jgi:GH25 family lysozyme M1 (1,4-beta-N-acetylmuramidase)